MSSVVVRWAGGIPDGIVLRCSISDLDWLAQFLIGCGCPFAVRQPPELVAALKQLAVGSARNRAAEFAPPLWDSL